MRKYTVVLYYGSSTAYHTVSAYTLVEAEDDAKALCRQYGADSWQVL